MNNTINSQTTNYINFSQEELLKLTKENKKKKIIFFDEPDSKNRWYNNVNQIYKKIFLYYNFDVITKRLLFHKNKQNNVYDIDENIIDKELKDIDKNAIYFFNPINFASFLINTLDDNLKINLKSLKDKIYFFLKEINYITIWSEIMDENLFIIGYDRICCNKNFIQFFFKNSILNLCSNEISISSLNKYDIKNNDYHITLGYSPINDLIPLNIDLNKTIDILIYGCDLNNFPYRRNLIKQIQENYKELNIVISDNLFDKNLDESLLKTKIVIHIPSHANLPQMPWAKISILQIKKVFFIIEENDELFEKQLNNFVVYYKRNDISDLMEKINFYLDNPLKSDLIEKNYEFIIKNNIDIKLPNIVNKIFDQINLNLTISSQNRYVFLNKSYDLIWTSFIFYYNMMEKIKNILKINNIPILDIINLSELKNLNANDIILIDPVLIIKNMNNLTNILDTKYILIIGENLDEIANTFIGWNNNYLNKLNFSEGNILNKLIKNAYKITYQNDKIQNLIKKIRNNDMNSYFFPIDGFTEDNIIKTNHKKDIDILIYCSMNYQRRIDLVKNLYLSNVTAKLNIMVCHNNFNLDELIDKSKIIVHCNCVDNCYHIPYAKIMKLLSNNKIVYVESTTELLKSELINYVKVFDLNQLTVNNNQKIPKYCFDIAESVKNYEIEQKNLNIKNPKKLIEEKYNFQKNVIDILN